VSSIATVHSGTVHATAVSTGGLDITVRLPRRYREEPNEHARSENTGVRGLGQIREGAALGDKRRAGREDQH
jgi:hypothetical protein